MDMVDWIDAVCITCGCWDHDEAGRVMCSCSNDQFETSEDDLISDFLGREATEGEADE